NLYIDAKKQLWALALRQTGIYGALYRYNGNTDRFEAFDPTLSDLFILKEDRNGALWGGNLNQLVSIDTVNRRHAYYSMGYAIRAIHEDRSGKFWIGTEGGGLLLFDRIKKTVTERYTTQEGLSNNVVLNILEDSTGNLWMSTYNGLSKFNIASHRFTNYDEGDGLQSKQFYFNAALALRDGEMLFGGIQGFSFFNPYRIAGESHAAQPRLTDIRISNSSVDENKNLIDRLSIDKIESLKIPYDQAILAFDYTALEYSSPGKISYAYYMEGWDRKWNYAGNSRTATYTHISEGHYTFRVKCTNAEGVWGPGESTIEIIVLPPWYRTWWAYSLYALALASMLYVYSRYRARQRALAYEAGVARLTAEREKLEREKKQAELEKAQAELEKDKAQHALELVEKEAENIKLEKEKEINEKRNAFFTNISHEFRTPLTLIINPVKDLLKQGADRKAGRQELDIIHRNARRMLSLVDQLLLFRRAESGVSSLHPVCLNFYQLCYNVFLCFTQQAKTKNIDYRFECDNPALELYADSEKIEIVFYNLLSNAVKYTPDSGRIVFSIAETASAVIVHISDTGRGIAKSTGDRLFEKFYQDHSQGNPLFGFGIGLYLVKSFTEEHKGSVAYESEPGKGTTFSITLLKGYAHFDGLTVGQATDGQPSLLLEMSSDDLPAAEAGDEKSEPHLKEIVTSRQSLLIADDDAQMRQYLKGLFSKDFAVHEAVDGNEGIAIAKAIMPDIIISDIKMQGGDGLEFCKAVKTDAALNHIPVILLTATTSKELKLDG
ncbi:MAG: response regulator, partial [Bacteroidetes bacterium]|nr:response regulator [Bacteroidota bacterium]